MPQLDRIIVFSQIFWLFIIFTSFYTILIHFFLPKFLKSLKLRKQVVEFNTLEVSQIVEKSHTKQNLLQKTLAENLVLVKSILTNNLSLVLSSRKDLQMLSIDEKISLVAFNTTKYCDIQLLNFISLRPKSLNLKLS